MNMGSAISYIFSKVGSIGQIFKGFSYFGNGGIGKSFSVIKQSGSHFDMRQGQDTVYTGWSLMWWITAIGLVLTNLLGVIFEGTFGFSTISNIAFGAGVSLIVYSFFIMKGSQNESHWKAGLVKALIVLYFVSIIGYCILLCVNVIGALIGFIGSLLFLGVETAIYTVLNILIDFCVNVGSIFGIFYILNGLNQACVANYNQNMGYNPNMNNGYNPNYNPNMQNGFNPNVAGVAGLGAINTVKNQSVGQDTTGFNQNQGNGYNPNNGYNQQNDFNANMNNGFNQQGYGQQNVNQNNQNVQMYACPYCGGAVTYGTNPCPHCRSQLNWG